MRGGGVARVLASRSKQAAQGDLIFSNAGWTQYAILPEGAFEPASRYPGLGEPQEMLSVLGLTGLTAWWGVTQIGKPKQGETAVISGAAGATGSVAGQIAKIKGARVIGIAGSDEKCKWLVDERGFDLALNYKADDFKQKFKEATPNFIDVFYDNGEFGERNTLDSAKRMVTDTIMTVGGEILDMALGRAAQNARFIQCGGISQYNTSKPKGPANMMNIVAMRITMQGFIVTDHAEHFPEARKELSQWVAEGKLKKSEHIIKGGINALQQGMIDLFKGANTGKLIVQVKDPNETPSKL